MSNKVEFLRGSWLKYHKIKNKNPNAFYFTTDTHDLYLGEYQLTNKKVKKIPTNCPNCGAVITKQVCDYCGTNFKVLYG